MHFIWIYYADNGELFGTRKWNMRWKLGLGRGLQGLGLPESRGLGFRVGTPYKKEYSMLGRRSQGFKFKKPLTWP